MTGCARWTLAMTCIAACNGQATRASVGPRDEAARPSVPSPPPNVDQQLAMQRATTQQAINELMFHAGFYEGPRGF